jgi:hypothetical protein
MAVRLYAVLRFRRGSRGHLPSGLQGEPVRILKLHGMSLAVGESPGTLSPSAENLIAFDRVVRSLAHVSEAILPARFDVVAENIAAMKADAANHAEALSAALDQVAGCVQMTVRLPPAEGSPRVLSAGDQSGPGARYLKTRQATSVTPALRRLRKAVSTLVRAERIESGRAGVSVFHLIHSGDESTYASRTASWRVSGPFPPYAFAGGIVHAPVSRHEHKKNRSTRSRSARSRTRRRGPGNAVG